MKSTNVQSVNQSPLHQKAEKLARALLGDDMAFDFDMLISKVSLTSVARVMFLEEFANIL